MLNQIILAIIQSITEFLPISSSGHLALISKILPNATQDIFFFTILHLASLLAVIIFTRKEIKFLFTFNQQARKLWIYLVIATIPAAIVGYYFSSFFTGLFDSYLFLGTAFIITGLILLSTRNSKQFSKLNNKNALAIGIAQIAAIFPGISRS